MRFVLAGGGTVGHVVPAIVVADRLRHAGAEVVFAGSAAGPEAELVPAAGYRFVPLEVRSAQTRVSVGSVAALWHAVSAARAVRPLVRTADAVVSFGGYASAPAILAARWSKVPLILVEQNAVPGAVHRIAARWARAVATTFDATAARLPDGVRVVRTGNPVRPELREVAGRREELRRDAEVAFGLEPGRLTVGVFGGSQGAVHLNRAALAAIPELHDRNDLQLLISTGRAHRALFDGLGETGALLVRPVAYVDRMELALAATDLAVSRSGAGMVAELAVCGVASILVPYPHATEQHQLANARELERAGAAEVLLDQDLDGGLTSHLLRGMSDPARRERMGAAATAWAIPDAADRIASLAQEAAA
ncbi:MAG TPA: undecaprenyldiphospho-muramoylpentapeptide beta-N-acetylglucosaminyltransferase [Actinomycetota bacterium]